MFDLCNLALKFSKADYAEARIESFDKTEIILKNGSIGSVELSNSSGIAIRVMVNGALGASFTNEIDRESIKKAVLQAERSAKLSSKILKTPIIFTEEKSNKANYSVKQKQKLENINIEDKLKILQDTEKQLLKTKIKLPSRFFDYSDEIREKFYVNSEGSKIHSIVPRINIFYLLTAVKGNDSEQRMNQMAGSGGFELIKKFKFNETVLSDAKILSKVLSSKRIKPDKYDVVLSPELVGIASHESTGHPYEADRILGREAAQAGESFVTEDLVNTRIGSDVVNLVDDPTVPNSYGFYLYDDEGIKARSRLLIRNGFINELLHNRWSASNFDVKSNGAARANNWDAEPLVRMANTFVMPGNHTFDELIEDVKNGVYIKSYMEWNIDDKRFNQRYGGLECYMIKNGELSSMVRKPMLEVTTPIFWSSIDAVGKDLSFSPGTCGKAEPMQAIPVCFGGPHVRMRNIRLR